MICVMARRQVYGRWIFGLLLWGAATLSHCCHPNSKELHVCLNIYLERDFPLIETILKGQESRSGYRESRVLLEGPDLQRICKDVSGLHACYKDLLSECNTYWQLDRFSRLLNLMSKTYQYLCGKNTNNVRDLLLNGACLRRAQTFLANCSIHNFSWTWTWREILRLQVDAQDRCKDIDNYKTCLVTNLNNVVCGQQAVPVYSGFIDVWLEEWCNKKSSANSDIEFLYLSLLFGRN